jgi:hypothetical protein
LNEEQSRTERIVERIVEKFGAIANEDVLLALAVLGVVAGIAFILQSGGSVSNYFFLADCLAMLAMLIYARVMRKRQRQIPSPDDDEP